MKEYINNELAKTPAAEITELLLDNITSDCIEGMDDKEWPALSHLSLIGCGLKSLDGLPFLPQCKIVDASENKLTSISDVVEKCPNLYHLNLCGNDIKTIDDLKPLAKLKNLRVLDVFDCPLAEDRNYRQNIFKELETLNFLDGFDENNEELDELEYTGYEELDDAEAAEELDEEDDEEDDDSEDVGLDYLNSSAPLKEDDNSEDYVAEKKNGLKRKAENEGDAVPYKKDNQEN